MSTLPPSSFPDDSAHHDEPDGDLRDFNSHVEHVLRSDGWEAAAAIIEQNWDRHVFTEPQKLLRAIRSLPGEAFVDRPTFLVAANYLQHVSNGTDPGSFNHEGWLDADMTGQEIGLINSLGLLTSRSAGARTTGDMVDARRAAELARQTLRRASKQERAAIRSSIPHFRIQWGRSLELADAPAADHEYEAAYELAMLTDQPKIARRAAAQRAWLSAERGSLRDAEKWLARARTGSMSNGRYDAVIYLTEALIRLDRGDLDGAEREFGRASGLDAGEYWGARMWVQSMLANDAASAAVADARLTHELSRWPSVIDAPTANGRYTRAARARLGALRRHSTKHLFSHVGASGTDRVIGAALAHGDGRFERALDIAGPVIMATDEPPRTKTAALIVYAAAAHHLGQSETATSAFIQAHAVIEDERLFTAYEVVPYEDVAALASLAAVPLHDARSAIPSHRAEGILLTRREHEILALMAQGRSMAELASLLFISRNTVKSTVRRLYKKLDVTSRSAAVDKARVNHLL